jgi:hypothetical protein
VSVLVGLEVVVGYLIAWGVRKARRAGERLDQDVDEVVDTGLDRLHDMITAKLGDDPAVAKLELEAAAGEISERTQRRVLDAVTDAAEDDEKFASRLEVMLAELDRSGGRAALAAAVGERSVVVGRDAVVRAEGGSVAGLSMGDVNLGGPAGPTGPGRSGD